MERFNVSYNNARRLARTEMSHIYNQSTLDKYKQAGVTKVKILTAKHGDHVCDVCESYEGKIYPIDKVPKIPCSDCTEQCGCTYMAAKYKDD